MPITLEQKAEIIKKFLNGIRLEAIVNRMKLSEKEVIKVLVENAVTKEILRGHLDKQDNGQFVNFLYKSTDLGRPKLPENQKRKIKQIRISDDEMSGLGNPSSTKMRSDLFAAKVIRDFCELLDQKGVNLIPEEWLEKEYPKTDSWYSFVYKDNFSRLIAVANNEKCWDSIPDRE